MATNLKRFPPNSICQVTGNVLVPKISPILNNVTNNKISGQSTSFQKLSLPSKEFILQWLIEKDHIFDQLTVDFLVCRSKDYQ